MERIHYVLAAVQAAFPEWLRYCRLAGPGRRSGPAQLRFLLPDPELAFSFSAVPPAASDPASAYSVRTVTLGIPRTRGAASDPALFCALTASMREALDFCGAWPRELDDWSLNSLDFGSLPDRPPALPDQEELRSWPEAAEGYEMIRTAFSRYHLVDQMSRAGWRVPVPPWEWEPRADASQRQDHRLLPTGRPFEMEREIDLISISESFARVGQAAQQAARDVEEYSRHSERLAVPSHLLTGRRASTTERSALTANEVLDRTRLERDAQVAERLARAAEAELAHHLRGLLDDDQRIGEEFFPGQAPTAPMDPNARVDLALEAPSMGHDVEPVLEKTTGPTMSFDDWQKETAALLKRCGHRTPTEEERDDE